MLRTVVLVSGGGTNLQAIIDRIGDGTLKDVEIACVLSNNPGAYALTRAKNAGIPALCLSPKDYETRERFNEALLRKLQELSPDLIVLAGFLVAIPEAVIRAFPMKIINIHPSLIPSFCGKGYYGLKVHERALERGVKVTGATVHFVDEGMDSGPIILQKAVEIPDGITPQELQQKVMKEAEWLILPRAISLIAQGRVVLSGKTTR
ncbi:MAG TPA: phosphoribosylglycinamide formyltransferase, partial [Lachnospiraceae bacterium]|nr:phosphoribosylglycinamide formyltransferase [Lachnospiraceae bacterium]